MKEKFAFKTGLLQLHGDPNFNYQLNRTVMWSGGDAGELGAIAAGIHDPASWAREMVKLGDAALARSRTVQAIACLRMAEFFMFDGDPGKTRMYERARGLFYAHFADHFKKSIRIERVPFEKGFLPVWVSSPGTKKTRDVILLHGGNDSYIEEFLPLVLYLKSLGFAVYLFEGPGQGEVLRLQGITFTPEWEKPAGAVLDAFGLEDVTIVGVSLGGMLAPRAAAFEKRIRRVVAWSIMPDFLDVLVSTRKKPVRLALRAVLSLRLRRLANLMARQQMRRNPMAHWGLGHGMHNFGVKTPYDYLRKAGTFRMTDVAHLIDQDFLLLGAQNDHFIPVEFYKKVLDGLTGVRSLTYRLFTDREMAGNHCNAGNTKLALNTIVRWIDSMKGRG
jgi:pimeloyl-ACP methyl ester carboxylesterase